MQRNLYRQLAVERSGFYAIVRRAYLRNIEHRVSRTVPVAIVGAACRLPGAPDQAAFWRLLDEGRCAVGDLPDGRWPAGRYLHSRAAEPGFSY